MAKDADAPAEAEAAPAKEEKKAEEKEEKKETKKTDKKAGKKDAKKDAKKDSKKPAKKAAKKAEKPDDEIPMDAAAIRAYSSVIADAAEDSEPAQPVVYHQVLTDDDAPKHKAADQYSPDPMGSMI